jgi:hypothetical protein
MSDHLLALLYIIAILFMLFAWVPVVDLICAPCRRLLKKLKREEPETVSGSTMSHPRYENIRH